jgi:membrane protease YdiL (CAAX protease family)
VSPLHLGPQPLSLGVKAQVTGLRSSRRAADPPNSGLIRIPVGTVVFEELAFRAVLLALLCQRFSLKAAVALDGALFGLWHIVPTLGTATANGMEGLARLGLVAGSVVATATGGVLFCALRVRGRHVLAPAMLHVAFNDVGYVLAWWVRS